MVLFVDSVNRSFKTYERQDHVESHMHAAGSSYLHAKLFQAQRNMYLTGSVIFLSLVLNRFYNMLLELSKSGEKMDLLKQQAANTTKEYLKLLDKDPAACNKCKDFDVVKKQANQTHEEYMALTDRYAALQKQNEGQSESKKDS